MKLSLRDRDSLGGYSVCVDRAARLGQHVGMSTPAPQAPNQAQQLNQLQQIQHIVHSRQCEQIQGIAGASGHLETLYSSVTNS